MSNATSFKKLFSESVIYGLSSIVGRFLNYLLVPLYTYKIAASSGGYGVITNIYAYTALLLVLLTFGMETTFFFFANKHKEQSKRVFSTALIMVSSVAILFLLGLHLFTTPVAALLNYGSSPEYLRIMGTVVALDAIQAIFFALLRFQSRAWKFAILKLTFIVLNIGLNLFIFLAAPHLSQSQPEMMGWYDASRAVYYVFLTNLICTALITIGFIPEMRLLRYGFDGQLMRKMLRYSWPLLIFGIIGILNQVADKICFRFLLPGAEGDTQLAIYGACVKIAMIMAMITQAFRYAYEPFVFGNGGDKQSKESQAIVMKYFIIFTLLAFLAVVAYMDLLRYITQSDYWEGLRVVPIVMMAEIFMGIYFNLSFWYKLTEKTWWSAILSACGCTVMLAVNIIFVPRYGYIACAWGGFSGYAVCMLMSYFLGHHYNPVPYPIKTILGYFALALTLYALMNLLKPTSTAATLLLNTGLLLLYAATVLYNEKSLIKKVLRKIKK